MPLAVSLTWPSAFCVAPSDLSESLPKATPTDSLTLPMTLLVLASNLLAAVLELFVSAIILSYNEKINSNYALFYIKANLKICSRVKFGLDFIRQTLIIRFSIAAAIAVKIQLTSSLINYICFTDVLNLVTLKCK